ncbi:MAG: TlpA family protein disulfide reductase [Corynebacterium pyruviciproducens]|uniref:TlpA family protein disulfide reductase n=1 Tax=Corynebacterium pyruviciproducens TaxID=598660 RepID=UPI0039835F3E
MMNKFARTILAVATAVATATSLAGCSEDQTAGKEAVAVGGTFSFVSPGGQTVITYPESERQPVQSFSGESLMKDGETISLDDYAGQVVVLNAWGQWCGPCRAEVDDLEEIHERLGGNGTVLGINVRDPQKDAARDFVTDNGVTYPSIYDPSFRTAAALGGIPATVIPTTIVLDKQHRPAAVFLTEVTTDDLAPIIDELVN